MSPDPRFHAPFIRVRKILLLVRQARRAGHRRVVARLRPIVPQEISRPRAPVRASVVIFRILADPRPRRKASNLGKLHSFPPLPKTSETRFRDTIRKVQRGPPCSTLPTVSAIYQLTKNTWNNQLRKSSEMFRSLPHLSELLRRVLKHSETFRSLWNPSASFGTFWNELKVIR